MCPLIRYPFLKTLLSPFRLSQQKSLALYISAIAEVAQAASLPLATHLASCLGIKVGSALRRFYRLLANPRINDQLLTSQLLHLLGQAQKPLLLSIDLTEWHHNLRMLLASAIVGTRAIPVQVEVFDKNLIFPSQNILEENFLRRLVYTLKEAGIKVIFLCDRGFRRVSWIRLLLELQQLFIVRIVPDVLIYKGNKKGQSLRSCHLAPGQAVDLGWVWVRQDKAVKVRVIGVWAPNQAEPWWLATNLDIPLAEVAALYDRRMGIEEQIRDSKGCRFGVKLEWTQFQTPRYLARFTLLVGVALILWTAVGHAVAQEDPSVRFPCKIKGPRLSLVQIGIRFLQKVANLIQLNICFIQQHLPQAQLRFFPWLSTMEATS